MATTTTLANDIGVLIGSEVVQGYFRNDAFFNMFQQRPVLGDTAVRWHVKTAGVTGTLKAEGDAFSAAQAPTNSRAVLGFTLHDATISITDHVKAAMGPGGSNSYWGALGREVVDCRLAIQQIIMTRWLAATGDGLRLAIDSTNTYAALDHAAVTGWASVDTAVNAALSYAVLDDMLETLRDDTHRTVPNLILCPENQITNYTRLSGPGVRTTFMQSSQGNGNNFDIGPNSTAQSFSGVPMVGVPEMTDTVFLFMKREDCFINYCEYEGRVGGWASEEIARGGFATQINMSWMGNIQYIDPFRAGTLTGVTA